MQSATGQYSTHAGEPAHPVQHSLMTARMCGLRLRCVVVPVDFGSYFTTDPALNSSMLGAPYAIKILHEWAAVSYSCRHRTCCQSGRFETFLKCFLFAGGIFYWLPGGARIGYPAVAPSSRNFAAERFASSVPGYWRTTVRSSRIAAAFCARSAMATSFRLMAAAA